MRKRILIIDPVRGNLATYIQALRIGGLKLLEVINTSTVEEAKFFLILQPISLIIINSQFISGSQDIFQQALRYHPSVKFIFLHSKSEAEHATLPKNSCYDNAHGLVMLMKNASSALL